MKKGTYIFCLMLLGLIISNKALSQTAIGFKGSLQMTKLDSKWNYSDNIETMWVYMPDFGVVVNFGYENPLSFQMEFNYSPKATKYTEFGEETKQTNYYLDLPLLLKAQFGKNEAKFYSIFGVTASFPFVIKYKSDEDESKVNIIKDETAIEYYLDAALSIGAGFSYELDNGSFFTEIRYNHGLGNTLDFGDYDSKALRLSVGYLFHL